MTVSRFLTARGYKITSTVKVSGSGDVFERRYAPANFSNETKIVKHVLMMLSVTPVTLEQNNVEILGSCRFVDHEHADLAHSLELKHDGIFIAVLVFSRRSLTDHLVVNG